MIKTFILGLDLLKVWFKLSLELSNYKKLLFNFCKAQLIESRRLAKIIKHKQVMTYLFEALITIRFF